MFLSSYFSFVQKHGLSYNWFIILGGVIMPEMVKLVHQDYDKISDICYWLTNEYVVKFTTELNRRNSKTHRITNYHKEIGYYVDGDYRVNINRDFNYYLSIESLRRSQESGQKLNIRISYRDMYFLNYRLREVAAWFTDKRFESLFIRDGNKILTYGKVDPIRVNLVFDNYIEFEPAVYCYNENEYTTGVNMYINSDTFFIFLRTDILLGFIYFLQTFNMYQCALLQLNYLGRPEFGSNYYDAGSFGIQNNVVELNNNKTQSFFDKVGAVKKE